MGSRKESGIKSQFEALSKGAHIDLLLPRSSEFDAPTILQNGSPEETPRVPSRRNLFFDEKANLTVILRTSWDEDNVQNILSSLELTLAAHATDAVPQGNGNTASASGKHDLTSITIPGLEAIDMLTAGDGTYVVWKPVLHLFRPRAKLQRPAIYFTAHLALSSAALDSTRHQEEKLLKSFEPLPGNVLEPLRYDPSLSEANAYLPESRITKVAPAVARTHDDMKPIRGASKRAFPIVPALFTRIRYSALSHVVVASLHLETTQLVNGTVRIQSVKLDCPNAKVENLCPLDYQKSNRPGDELVLLHKFVLTTETTTPNVSATFVQIGAVVTTDQGSEIELDIKWQAQVVDLSQIVSKPNYKWSRPLSGTAQLPARPSSHGAERPASLDASQKASSRESGITFNFTAPLIIAPDQDFSLNVQCINRSARPRRFALVFLQPKRTHTKAQQQDVGTQDADLIASLFNAPPLEREKSPDVLDLNPDVRIGPLLPGACVETQMKFRPTTTGVLDLGVARIVDLDSRQTVDVRELPDIVALEKTVEEQPLDIGPDNS